MLSECSSRLNQVHNKNNSKSPYFLQYKIFEERLRNQSLKPKIYHKLGFNCRTGTLGKDKNKQISKKEDYMILVK